MPRRGSGPAEVKHRRLPELEQAIGYAFKRRELLCESLTHKSAASETADDVRWNERLEFLGDSVLGLAVTRRLMERYPRAQEGELSRIRASLVNETSLASLARKVHLGRFVAMGRGEEKNGGRERDALLADTFEAVLGALYLDGGAEEADQFVGRFFDQVLADAKTSIVQTDYKTLLQELTQEQYKMTPRYRLTTESGPDHQKTFAVSACLDDLEIGQGAGASKKKASQEAAQNALERLAEPAMARKVRQRLLAGKEGG